GREMIATGGGKIVNMASQASVIALDKCTKKREHGLFTSQFH
ncbi:short chain dehydrogenase, partial [Listeria ivanovii FSL F6-596]